MRAGMLVCVCLLASCSGNSGDSGVCGTGTQECGIRKVMAAQVKDGEVMKKQMNRVLRVARGAGRWFPGNGKALESLVYGFIMKAEVPQIKGRIVGAIAPHAGYVYSGSVAGYTFKAIQANAAVGKPPETVVILGFSHRNSCRGVALMDGDAVVTPMGEVDIDVESTRFLAGQDSRIIVDYQFHGDEHSAENEIPFVQAALPGAKVVVGLFGDHDGETLDAMVSALSELAKKKRILVLASTDMLHDPSYDLVTKTDKATLDRLAAMDSGALVKRWSMENQIFCGVMPVLAVMKFSGLQGCRKASVLHYRNSGDDFPESRGSWVVGYGSAVFTVQD